MVHGWVIITELTPLSPSHLSRTHKRGRGIQIQALTLHTYASMKEIVEEENKRLCRHYISDYKPPVERGGGEAKVVTPTPPPPYHHIFLLTTGCKFYLIYKYLGRYFNSFEDVGNFLG